MNQLEKFKQAAELAQEAAPESKIFVYCYKDKVVNRFAPIFTTDKEPKFMVDGLTVSVKKGQNVKELTGLSLCFCGTFELATGKFDLFDLPQVIVDCDVLIEKVGGIGDVGKVN